MLNNDDCIHSADDLALVPASLNEPCKANLYKLGFKLIDKVTSFPDECGNQLLGWVKKVLARGKHLQGYNSQFYRSDI